MARSYTITQLPLDRYAKIMQIPLTHFNQLDGELAPLSQSCDDIWDQDARDLLAWTMQVAEQMIAIQLGTQVSPKFITEENVNFGLPGVKIGPSNFGSLRLWENAEVQTEFAQVECFGTEQLTLVMAGATVEYLDLDNDPFGRPETAEIGNLLYDDLGACAEECDVAIFFTVADGAKDAADPSYEIRPPKKIDIDGTTMKLQYDSSMFVFPHLWDLTELDCVGSDEPDRWKWQWQTSNLVSNVDVYCRTVNLQTPVTLLWDGVCDCDGICQHKTQLACAFNTDNKRGFFAPRAATWDGTKNVFVKPTHSVPPDSVKVNYRAGFPLDRNCRMNASLERAIVKLTNVLLPEPPCGFCDAAQVRWQNDRKVVDSLTTEAANLPWDLNAQGALEAWRIIKMFTMGRGVKIGRGYR